VSAGVWSVRLTAAAQADFEGILRWTEGQFGRAQAHRYADTISAALDTLTAGPAIPGATKRDDILEGIFALHVARSSRKGRHFIMFRIGQTTDGDVSEVLRLLHDAMDLERHLP
jgi:toxin ParE1/3/4